MDLMGHNPQAELEVLEDRQSESFGHNQSPNGGRLWTLIGLVRRLNQRHEVTVERIALLERRVAELEGE